MIFLVAVAAILLAVPLGTSASASPGPLVSSAGPWTKLPTTSPFSTTSSHGWVLSAPVFYPPGQEIVVVAQRYNLSYLYHVSDSTWVFKDGNWLNLKIPTPHWYNPPYMIYDSRNRDVLATGYDSNANWHTWTFQNNQWTVANHGRSLYLGCVDSCPDGIVYDASTGQPIMFGGDSGCGDCDSNLSYEFHAGQWHRLGTVGFPLGSYAGDVFAYDPPTQSAWVLFGENYGTIWEVNSLHAGVWKRVAANPALPFAYPDAMEYDGSNHQMVMFDLGDDATWAYFAGQWHNVTSGASPPDCGLQNNNAGPQGGLVWDPEYGGLICLSLESTGQLWLYR
jgi:hypothetical protein